MNISHLTQAITAALRECERCPDDSVEDIFNEQFASWQLPIYMTNNFNIEFDSPMIPHNLSKESK